MKLLILLFIISNVYCGITNNFTVLPNNDIYIAHTENSVIYKKINSSTIPQPIVGQQSIHSKIDEPGPLNGSSFHLYRPTSIISNLRNDIYFVNNDKYIKHFNTFQLEVRGITINPERIFNVIANITINTSHNLYVANYSAGKSTIYKFEYINSYTFTEDTHVLIINEEIKAINCVNNSINVITNKSYYKYSLELDDNTIEEVTNKIESTNNTNKLEDIQDFVIDENFEIGYIAFQERLKWFYF
jgi:hypothetical protein